VRERQFERFESVITGLVPVIHVLLDDKQKDVDARHKAGHDGYSQTHQGSSQAHSFVLAA
jgi:hypothetical protein